MRNEAAVYEDEPAVGAGHLTCRKGFGGDGGGAAARQAESSLRDLGNASEAPIFGARGGESHLAEARKGFFTQASQPGEIASGRGFGERGEAFEVWLQLFGRSDHCRALQLIALPGRRRAPRVQGRHSPWIRARAPVPARRSARFCRPRGRERDPERYSSADAGNA